VVFDVHQEAEMMQEISADDGLPDICNNECPVEGTPEAQIESE
jgi:hypothetical protein